MQSARMTCCVSESQDGQIVDLRIGLRGSLCKMQGNK